MLTVPTHLRQRSGYLEIADYIESQVVGGVLQPNDRLPNTPELLELFGVSRDTLQRALTRLSRRGLIRRVPRRGTFVTAGVASHTVGLVFGKDPFTSRSGFYRETLSCFLREGRLLNVGIKAYLFHEEATSLSTMRDLERDIREGRLRCLVSLYLSGLLGHWIADHDDLPILLPPDSDVEERVRLGLENLLARGAKHPLVLSLIRPNTEVTDYAVEVVESERAGVAKAWAAAGMDGEPPSPILMDETPEASYSYIKERFSRPGPRPDAILVNHDLCANGVLYALAELGLDIPGDVIVATHENRGCEHFSPSPLIRLVCDPCRHVRATFDYIRQQGLRLIPGRQLVPGKIPPELVID